MSEFNPDAANGPECCRCGRALTDDPMGEGVCLCAGCGAYKSDCRCLPVRFGVTSNTMPRLMKSLWKGLQENR